MRRHPYIALLAQHPWAILESYLPTIAAVLSRIALDQPMTAADRETITRRRAQFAAAHPGMRAWADDDDYADRPPPEPFAKVTTSGGGGAVAVIGVYGVLTQRGGLDPDTSEPLTSTAQLANAIRVAAADPQIGGIVLDVDSPGGSVYGLAELGDTIYGLRDSKPIAAVANSLTASAAYWMASQAGELYAAPGAEVGSIGVYTVHWNIAKRLEQEGVSAEFISAGKYKTELATYGPLSDEARAYVQASVDDYYDQFVRSVSRGRGTSLKAVREGMGQGRVLSADKAKAENMIDGIATLGEVISKVGARAKRSGSARAAMQRETDVLSLG